MRGTKELTNGVAEELTNGLTKGLIEENGLSVTGGKAFRNFGGLKGWKDLLKEEDGMGTVEIILIVVVLIGLVIIFKSQMTQLVQNIFSKITSQTNKI